MKTLNNLHYLLKNWVPNAPLCFFNTIKLDSRKIVKGDLFIAVLGCFNDGRNFILEAISNGAVAILAEANGKTHHGKQYVVNGIPVIYLSDLNKKLSTLAKIFYRNPGKKQKIIGVTGTNGKTTVTQLIAQWVNLIGEKSAVMGTMGYGLLGHLKTTSNTTESAINVQKILYLLDKEKVNLTSMEISSHALLQHRVSDINFSAGIFTNLSHDHLDYHNSMESYKTAKWSFFTQHKIKQVIINIDDKIGKKWLENIPNAVAVSINQNIKINIGKYWLKVVKIHLHKDISTIFFNSSWGQGTINTILIGDFNISNLMLALATLLTLKYPLDSLLRVASKLQPIHGRMELFFQKGKPKLILDYAHTPEALKLALIAARKHCTGKLWCLFGCGGGRDKSKRPIMGSISKQFADISIITQDNPRTEDPDKIINDILSGMKDLSDIYVINERIKAIVQCFITAEPNDLILIAGKGHETYQIIGDNYFQYSDQTIIKHLLEEKYDSNFLKYISKNN
ncbi:UDP-N-acetylmuramoyl-L-alanyl-D-glutamate--2,6-diaminopimelate ligase [Candidatus Pantoea edessiphila]|uniref:UDP-N-acetylmuramoyl-L-alanyl-D-glutamate--2, 6-diaminopimelate ligase n=1 Tax=Candidatus Pantoea edessiphila TaxID=2044610 RepID=UPI003BAEF5B9